MLFTLPITIPDFVSIHIPYLFQSAGMETDTISGQNHISTNNGQD